MALTEVKQEWNRFKHDPPGHRFELHRQRMERQPRWQRVLRVVGGGLLVAIGIVFLFLPGPGFVGILFGLALIAGMSHWLARRLDRAEPKVRDKWRRTKARLKRDQSHSPPPP